MRLSGIILISCMLLSGCGSNTLSNPASNRHYRVIEDTSQLQAILAEAEEDSMNVELRKGIWSYYTRLGHFGELIADATKVYNDALESEDDLLAAYAAAYLSQAYLFMDVYGEAAYYLEKGREILQRLDKSPAIPPVILNNVAAIYAIKTSMDYPKAAEELKKSLDILEAYDDTLNICSILCNISSIYTLREDTSGMQYARQAYIMSKNLKDLNIKTLSIVSYSSMLYLQGKYLEARKYAEEAIFLIDSTHFMRNMSMAYLNYGKIMAALGKTNVAMGLYDEAIRFFDAGAEEGTRIETLLSQGNLFLSEKRFEEAAGRYKEALAICTNSKNIEYKYKILQGLSSVYESAGNTDSAYYYFKLYHTASETAFNLKKEQQFSDLEKEYIKADHERYEKEAEMKIMRKSRNNVIALSIIAVILILLAYSYVYNRRQHKMYVAAVRRYNVYKQRIEEIKVAEIEKQKKETEELFGIYSSIECKMKEEMFFRDKSLSLEMCAETLNTTTQKLSMAVNKYSGMSFPNYVNRYRIFYVTDRLADKNEKEPMIQIFEDAGFYSKATAYRCFQKEVGCSPSQYRETVMKSDWQS